MSDFIYPKYDGESLLNVPHTVLKHFGINSQCPTLKEDFWSNIQGCETVLLFLLDGLGANLYNNQAQKYDFYRLVKEKANVHTITSVFPSTTPNALSTLHSGLKPIQHGLIEWNLYIHQLDSIIETLPYRAVATEADEDKILTPNPKLQFNSKTIYETLMENGVTSFIFMPEFISGSSYSFAIGKGAHIVPYRNINDLSESLLQTISKPGQKYCYVYWDKVDSAEHDFGVNTEEVDTAMADFSSTVQNLFLSKVPPKGAENIALLLTADHGQTNVYPERTIILNNFPLLINNLKKRPNGKPIYPTGNVRDIFLNIEEDKVDTVVTFLKKEIGDRVDVLKITEETIVKLFGTEKPHPDFYSRFGNVLLLPKTGESIWYEYSSEKKFLLRGHHGGLSQDEMEIPFITTKLSELL